MAGARPPILRPLPTVLLRHELPDGSAHVDWLLAQDPDGVGPLLAFRLPNRLDELTPGAATPTIAAERIADHRAAYLTFEGAIAGDRGTVRRLESGVISLWEGDESAWTLEIVWAGASRRPQRLRVERRSGCMWRLTALSPPSRD